jgi:hypothetical protein
LTASAPDSARDRASSPRAAFTRDQSRASRGRGTVAFACRSGSAGCALLYECCASKAVASRGAR